jgi:Chondroitinase B
MLDQSYLGSIASAGAGAAVPAPAQANCFVESGADTVVVSSMSALQSAVNAAPPGRQILIAPGTYNGGTLIFNRDGTKANPIVVRPQNGLGTVSINNARWEWADTSSWLVFSKLHFEGPFNIFRGDHNRITRCRFRNFGTAMRMTTARDCRIDHCDFSATPAAGASDCVGIDLRGADMYVPQGTAARNLIDYCYFHGAGGDNRLRPINQFGGGNNALDSYHGATRGETVTIDHCLFENCRAGNEFVVIKGGGTVVRFCTFDNCDGYLQFRGAFDCELRSCWIEDMARNPTAVRIFGDNQLIIGNRLVGADGILAANGLITPAEFISGAFDSDRYVACTNCKFIGNRFESGQITFGWGLSGTCNIPTNAGEDDFVDEPVRNALLEANTRDDGGSIFTVDTQCVNPAHVNTTINSTTSESYTPAVKIPVPTGNPSTDQVGLVAPDPLCSSGPQS